LPPPPSLKAVIAVGARRREKQFFPSIQHLAYPSLATQGEAAKRGGAVHWRAAQAE